MMRTDRQQPRAARRAAGRATGQAAAWRAWVRGDIDDAERLAAGLSGTQRAHLLFLTNYLRGRYEEALGHYGRVGRARSVLKRLDEPVVNAWLHLGRPDDAVAHVRRRNQPAPPDLLLRAERPLRAELAGPATVLPFADHALAPYLPVVPATIDGHQLPVHLDTGGTFVVMGTERATALGISTYGEITTCSPAAASAPAATSTSSSTPGWSTSSLNGRLTPGRRRFPAPSDRQKFDAPRSTSTSTVA